MKHKLLPLLVAGLTAGIAGPAVAAAPTVYGKVNVTLHKFDLERVNGNGVKFDHADNWELESNASRIGIKGDFDITDNLKAIYKLEYEVTVDGDDDTFSQRNIYGGFQGNFGTLIAGKHDTPLKLAQGDVDRFNDLAIADIKNIMVGENRQSNIVMYSTPSIGGFGATVAFMPGEETVDAAGQKVENDGIADAVSAAITYSNDLVYLALAHDKDVDTYDATRVVADFNLGAFTIGGMYQTAEHGSDAAALKDISDPIKQFGGSFEEQDAYLLSGVWKMNDKWSLKAQYGYSESTPLVAGWGDAEATLYAVGLDYKLGKNAKVFAYYANLEAEGDYDIAFNSTSTDDSTFAIGYELKF